MALVSKPHTFANGEIVSHTEHNENYDALFGVVNGGIDEDNLSPSIAIPNSALVEISPTIVGDFSADVFEYGSEADPGDTATPSLPTDLTQELGRVRRKLASLRGYSLSPQYTNSSGVATSAAWVEPRIVGHNLLPNPGFEVHTQGATSAPNGWTTLGTLTDCSIANPAHTGVGLEKRSLKIDPGASSSGIQCTVAGLKTGVKYLVGVAYSLTSGTINLVTTGGLASGNYRNLGLTDAVATTAGSFEVLQGVVKPTTTPGSIVVQIYGTTAAADFNLHYAWMYELQDGHPVEQPSLPVLTATDTTAANVPAAGWTGTGNTWRTETQTALSLTQYVPYPGYRLTYEVQFPFRSIDATDEAMLAYGAIQLNIDGGGASTVSGPVFYEGHAVSSNGTFGGTFSLRHIVDNPTPGSSYAFTFLVGVYDGADYAQMTAPPLVNSVQMEARARLIMEKL